MNNAQKRSILKVLTAVGIDSQYLQQLGAQAFNGTGEVTPEYKDVCSNLKEVINDMQKQLTTVNDALMDLLKE